MSYGKGIAEDMHIGATFLGMGVASAIVGANAARAGARAEIREIAHGTIARWQSYCNSLKAKLTMAKAREDKLAQDLADAMSIIETLELENRALRVRGRQ